MDFNNRQYDPQIGRFLSVDPLATSTDAFSPYVAMNNDPASLTDPDGLRVGDHREMAWGSRYNQFFWDAYLIDAQEYLNTNHIAEFIAQNPWASGANASITTLYGDRARSFFAALTGQSFTGGGVDAEEAGPQKGFTDEQVQQAGWTITGENEKEYFASRWVVNNGDIKTLHKEFGRFQKPPSANEQNDMQLNWYGPGGQANWFLGAAGTALENTAGSFRLTNGAYNGSALSFKYYASAWRGGSRARITTYNIGKIGGFIGKASFGAALIMDGVGLYNYYRNPNSANVVSPGKFGFNTGIGLYSLKVSPALGIIYFGVDAFYPGGWLGDETNSGAIMDVSRTIEGNQRIIPNSNIYRDIRGGW